MSKLRIKKLRDFSVNEILEYAMILISVFNLLTLVCLILKFVL